jgi:hypothetical protein
VLETNSAADTEAKLVAVVAAVVPAEERDWVTANLRPLVGLSGEQARA